MVHSTRQEIYCLHLCDLESAPPILNRAERLRRSNREVENLYLHHAAKNSLDPTPEDGSFQTREDAPRSINIQRPIYRRIDPTNFREVTHASRNAMQYVKTRRRSEDERFTIRKTDP